MDKRSSLKCARCSINVFFYQNSILLSRFVEFAKIARVLLLD